METIYLVYKTDVQHSYSSRDIIGVTSTPDMAIEICKAQAKKEGDSIDTEQLFNLQNIKQTQGYSGEGEFQYESISVNVLL